MHVLVHTMCVVYRKPVFIFEPEPCAAILIADGSHIATGLCYCLSSSKQAQDSIISNEIGMKFGRIVCS